MTKIADAGERLTGVQVDECVQHFLDPLQHKADGGTISDGLVAMCNHAYRLGRVAADAELRACVEAADRLRPALYTEDDAAAFDALVAEYDAARARATAVPGKR